MPTTDIKQKFLKASLWSSFAAYFFFTFNFFCQWIFSHLLSPTQFGVFAFGIAVREVIGMFCVIAMPGGYIKSAGNESDFAAYMVLTWCATAAQVLISAIVALYYVFYQHDIQIALVIILLAFSQGFILMGYVYMATLERKLEYKSISLLQGGATLFSGLIAIFLAYYFHTVLALVVRDLLGAAIVLTLLYRKTKFRLYFKCDLRLLKTQLIFGVKCAFARMAEVSYYRIPELLISFFLSKTFLGYFYQGRYLAYFPIKLFQPFTNSVLFSYLAHHKDEPLQLQNQFWWINYVVIRALLPICGVIYLFGAKLLVLLYGGKWLIAGECFSYFSIFILAGVLFMIVTNMANLLGKQSHIVQSYVIALLIFLVSIIKLHNIVDLAFIFSAAYLIAVFYVTACLLTKNIISSLLSLYYPIIAFFVAFGMCDYGQASIYIRTLVFFVLLATLYLIERKNIVRLLRQFHLRKLLWC